MKKFFRLAALLVLASIPPRAAFAAPNWSVFKDVKYGVSEQEKADLYLLNKGINPVVVFIHGGGWQSGDKSVYAGYYAELYARAGFHVVSINYRLARHGDRATQWNAQLQDVQLAIRWLRQNAAVLRIDPTRIGAFGDSAGGQLALFLGSLATSASNLVPASDRSRLYPAQSPKVSAVVDMFGPADLTRPDMYPQLASLAVFGSRPYAQAPYLYKIASPIFSLTRQSAPSCIVQGTTDTVVPMSQSVLLAGKLYQLGVPFKWLPFMGGHWFVDASGDQKTAIDNAALACISAILRPNPWNAL